MKHATVRRRLRRSAGYLLLALGVVACSDPVTPTDERLVQWSVPSAGARTRPLILDSLVVVGTLQGAARALHRATGSLAWETELAPTEVRGDQLGAAAGVVLVPHRELWGLAEGDGRILWRYGGPDGLAGYRTPLTAGDTVFVGSPLGWASSIDARTGTPYWSVDLGEALFPPTVSPELVIFGTRGFFGVADRDGPLGAGHVVALRRSDGSVAWTVPLPDSIGFPLSGGAISGGVVWGDRVIIGTKSAWVVAIRLTDGEVLWSKPNGGPPPTSQYYLPPALVDGVVVFPRPDYVWEGWDAATGHLIWTWQEPAGVSPPVSVAGLLYTFGGPLTIADRHGNVLWRGGGLQTTFPYGGTSYWFGDVSSDGLVYTLATAGLGSPDGTTIAALRPPIGPN